MSAPNRDAPDTACLTRDFLKRLRALDGSKSNREPYARLPEQLRRQRIFDFGPARGEVNWEGEDCTCTD